MSSAPAFSAELHDAIDASDEAVVSVDCSEVTFMGSAGYRALVDATEYATRRGHTLVVRNMSSSCATVIRVFADTHDLTIEPSAAPRPLSRATR